MVYGIMVTVLSWAENSLSHLYNSGVGGYLELRGYMGRGLARHEGP